MKKSVLGIEHLLPFTRENLPPEVFFGATLEVEIASIFDFGFFFIYRNIPGFCDYSFTGDRSEYLKFIEGKINVGETYVLIVAVIEQLDYLGMARTFILAGKRKDQVQEWLSEFDSFINELEIGDVLKGTIASIYTKATIVILFNNEVSYRGILYTDNLTYGKDKELSNLYASGVILMWKVISIDFVTLQVIIDFVPDI